MLSDDGSNFFYYALLISGGIFAIYNIVLGFRNLKRERTKKDNIELLKENIRLKKQLAEVEKLIL